METLMKWVVIAGAVIAIAGGVSHHVWACEGGSVVSGQIVTGDTVEEVLAKLERKDV